MLKKCFEDRFMLLSTLTVLMFAGIPSLTSLEIRSKRSTTSLYDTPIVTWQLLDAAGKGNLENVKDAVANGADVDFDDGSVINKASAKGHVEVVRYLLEAGANPNGTEVPGMYTGKALVSAAENNHLEIVNLLIDAGVNLEPVMISQKSALKEAAERGHLEVVQRLVEAGADIHYRDDWAVRVAAMDGQLDVVKFLLKAGANVSDWAINRASASGYLEVVKVLIEYGTGDEDLDNALYKAASFGHLDLVKFLLQKGGDPNYDETLKRAAGYGNVEVVRVLLDAGANINCTGRESSCPLHKAAQNGHKDIVALLVEYGSDINRTLIKDFIFMVDDTYGEGWSVMHLAARYGYVMSQELLDLGADINLRDAKGRTPLYIAIDAERFFVAKELLKFCADVTIADDEGRTPLDMARNVALRNTTETYRVRYAVESIMRAMLQVMPEKIASSPSNEAAVVNLTKEFVAIIEANSTLKEQLGGNYVKHQHYIRFSLYQIFAERARNGMIQIIEDHSCKLPLQEKHMIAVGTAYLATCDCVLGHGPKMTFTLRQEDDQCVSASVVKGEEEVLPDLQEPKETTEIQTEVKVEETEVA